MLTAARLRRRKREIAHAVTPRRSSARLAALTLGVALAITSDARAEHSNALWLVVHDLCVLDKRLTGAPAPCAAVDLARGWAVVGDPKRRTHFLLVPTRALSGIESPDLFAADSPNYWRAAWDARRFVARRLGRPIDRADVGLAINSIGARTQDQLHIHIDCVRADVRASLAAWSPAIGPVWSDLPGELNGDRYRARWVEGEELGDNDPFKLLAEEDPVARADMARETLVVLGGARADGAPGFILLSARAAPERGDRGAGEELLDHGCRALRPASRPQA